MLDPDEDTAGFTAFDILGWCVFCVLGALVAALALCVWIVF
jgi:hypothetical protein